MSLYQELLIICDHSLINVYNINYYINITISMSSYDLIIVGGGIAGLRVGIEVLKKQPDINCCILEKYGYIGGRIVTFRKNIPKIGEVQWENGAGRIATTHKKVLRLLNDYDLTFIPIGSESSFINEKTAAITENNFNDLIGWSF